MKNTFEKSKNTPKICKWCGNKKLVFKENVVISEEGKKKVTSDVLECSECETIFDIEGKWFEISLGSDYFDPLNSKKGQEKIKSWINPSEVGDIRN